MTRFEVADHFGEGLTGPVDPAHGMRPGGVRLHGMADDDVDDMAQALPHAPRAMERPGEAGTPGARQLLFTAEEYEARLAAVRRRMVDQGLSGLVVTDPSNIFYLVGYNAWSFYTPQLLFVPLEGSLTFFARDMDARGAKRTTWLPEVDIVGYPERYVQRPHIHPFDWVAFALRQRWEVSRAATGCVGVEMDSHFFSVRGFRALSTGIPEWRFVDCFELVNWVRAVKSPAELDLMRAAARVTEAAMDAAIAAIEPGARQSDVAAAISGVQIRGVAETWGDYPAIVPMLPTGESADTPHLTWSDRVIAEHDAVVVELAGVHHRYHVPLARTICLGAPSREILAVTEVVAEALEVVLDEIEPGVPLARLSYTWDRILAKYGLEKPSRLGYSIGVGFPPDWGERTMSIRREDDQVLAPGMTFHLICGMWMTGYGYEVSESLAVTESGCEVFTDVPRTLLRKG